MLTGADYVTLEYALSIYKRHVLGVLKNPDLTSEGGEMFQREIATVERLAEKLRAEINGRMEVRDVIAA